jgi:hypothetical protein
MSAVAGVATIEKILELPGEIENRAVVLCTRLGARGRV